MRKHKVPVTTKVKKGHTLSALTEAPLQPAIGVYFPQDQNLSKQYKQTPDVLSTTTYHVLCVA